MQRSEDRVSWELLRTLATLGWVTGETTPHPSGEGVVLEVRYAADPPDSAPRLVAGMDAGDAARVFLAQLTAEQR